MTDPELIEAMARAIKRQLQLYADMAGMDFRANDLEMAARAVLAVARPAIEAALLESMEEPSAAMLAAGRYCPDVITREGILAPRALAKGIEYLLEGAWRAMLAAFRRERLKAEAPE